MNRLELPRDKELASRVLQSHDDERARDMERGLIGRVFGMAREKPQNGAIFAFGVSAVMLLAVYFGPGDADQKSTVVGIVGSVFTGSIGYLFGGASKS